jgi:hypothetical protein
MFTMMELQTESRRTYTLHNPEHNLNPHFPDTRRRKTLSLILHYSGFHLRPVIMLQCVFYPYEGRKDRVKQHYLAMKATNDSAHPEDDDKWYALRQDGMLMIRRKSMSVVEQRERRAENSRSYRGRIAAERTYLEQENNTHRSGKLTQPAISFPAIIGKNDHGEREFYLDLSTTAPTCFEIISNCTLYDGEYECSVKGRGSPVPANIWTVSIRGLSAQSVLHKVGKDLYDALNLYRANEIASY